MEKINKREKDLFKEKNDITETATNFISTNFPKYSMTKLSNSNLYLNNSSNQKILIQDHTINNNSDINDSLLQLNLRNNDNNNDSSKENKKIDKKSNSLSKVKNKSTIKLSINKKSKIKESNYPNVPIDNKNSQTIFQKIITNLDKVKTKADKTLDAMRKNLRISRNEIVKRRNYQKISQLVPTNILIFEKNEEKQKFLRNLNRSQRFNNSQQSFYMSKLKNKSISNILPNISSNDNNINQSISNGSSIININNLNEISDYNTININNTSSNMNIFNGFKTGIKSRSQINLNNKSLNKTKTNFGFKAKLNLYEIPRESLISIKNEYPNKPLFPFEKNKNCYKNMYHSRSLDFPLKLIRAHCYKVYGIPAILVEQKAYNKNPEMNTLLVINKIELIQDNIDYFKINFMYKNDFLEAFNNMENYQKAEFNYNFEEICCVIIKMMPIIFQNYYDILKKLLCVVIPNIKEEREKKPENEKECLNFNYSFFNAVSEYFNICLEVYKVLNKKCDRFNYTINEFAPLNSYLDITRYNTTNLISMANSFINKTKNDVKILDKLEVALKMKKAIKEEVDIFERYHKRHRKKELDEDIKVERINRALNLKSRINRPEINEAKYFDKYKVNKKVSAFNSSVFRDMMKYFKPNIKAKIIAQQVVDRYEQKKKKYGNVNENEID
jgi:hypothetical protein